MQKIKSILFSKKAMPVINALFFLGCFLRSNIWNIILYGLWIVYLVFCIKSSKTKDAKHVYAVLIGIAAVIILLNIRYLFRY